MSNKRGGAANSCEGSISRTYASIPQQAAEKTVKALLVSQRVRFPRAHDLATLLTLVQQAGYRVPGNLRKAAILTGYRAAPRCGGVPPHVAERVPELEAGLPDLSEAVSQPRGCEQRSFEFPSAGFLNIRSDNCYDCPCSANFSASHIWIKVWYGIPFREAIRFIWSI